MKTDSKIYIAGHRGIVGDTLLPRLQVSSSDGDGRLDKSHDVPFTNIIHATYKNQVKRLLFMCSKALNPGRLFFN
jgi:hypothetical protein